MRKHHTLKFAGEASPSLIDAIAAYRAGKEAFEAIHSTDHDKHGGEQAVIASTYGTPLDVLEHWQHSATNLDEIAVAIGFALEEAEEEMGDCTMTRILRAAFGYLKRFEPETEQPAEGLSPGISIALDAMAVLQREALQIEVEIKQFEDKHAGRFGTDNCAFVKWARETDGWDEMTTQRDLLEGAEIDLRMFVIKRECFTLDDVVAKIRIASEWLDGPRSADHEASAEDYATENHAILKSMLRVYGMAGGISNGRC